MTTVLMSEIADIARKLNDRERDALLWLPEQGWTQRAAYWRHSNAIKALSHPNHWLTQSRPHPTRQRCLQWSLTTLGLAVRLHLNPNTHNTEEEAV